MQKIFVINNGCEEGQLKSMNVQQFFHKNGFAITRNLAEADLVVFFACGLTDPKEKQSLIMIRKLRSQKKVEARLVVWGCLPKINPMSLREVYDGPIVGPKDLQFFENLLTKTILPVSEVSANALIIPETLGVPEISQPLLFDSISNTLMHIKRRVDYFRLPRRKWLFDSSSYFVRVSEGCTGKCTYCSERPAWGGVRSRPIEKIVEEFKVGLERGFKRFFLVAADLGAYGFDINSDPISLLKRLLQEGGASDFKLIINQMNPSDFVKLLPELEKVFASGKIEAIGCQVESGSNRIIRAMGRKYTAKSWRDCMLRINRRFPFVRLSTHIMIGFPGETEEDFTQTMNLLDFPLFVDWIGFFVFSPRPSVYASSLPEQVSMEVKQLRFIRLYRKYLFMYILNVALGNLRYLKSKIKLA